MYKEKKATEQNIDAFDRNISRIHHELEEMGYKIINPTGTKYDERDASIEANLINPDAKKITKTLKPAIFKLENGGFQLIQKAVVIVE